MKKIALPFLVLVMLSVFTTLTQAAEKLTVVELFTSQGCSSCPPADTYLGELAKRDDIIALSLHVDYWDYIGWKDPYSLPRNTTRQRDYARNLDMGYVYTPQMVVQGMAHTTGSNRKSVEQLIQDVEGAKRLDITISLAADGLQLDIPGGTFEGETAKILVAAYDKHDENNVTRGENSGYMLEHYNVVREMTEVGTWTGEPVSMVVTDEMVKMAGRNGCAVLVQSTRNGRILGAARIGLTPQG
jgi:hypothetical protein